MSQIRTRFAPSPTGELHLGSLRTALFNWLWARKNKGLFILRIEDTDQSRLLEGSQENLITDLTNLGLTWDYGPDKCNPDFGSCIQSQRLDLYQSIAQELIDKNVAYYDYTTSEQLANLRQKAQQSQQAFIFRQNMAHSKAQYPNQKPVIRIAIPENLSFSWQDVVKGQQTWQSNNIGDFVILKSDGWPTYHLANVIDDYHMHISHVIRADEWLSSTPKHLYLFECLDWQKPTYVHVPPILASTGNQKLSKRDHAFKVRDLINQGYINQALINYLSLLGWNPKTNQEIFSIDELIKLFEIEQIQVSGARFNQDRLNWFNGQHIRQLHVKDFKTLAENYLPEIAASSDQAYQDQVLQTCQSKITTLSEISNLTQFFFETPKQLPEADYVKLSKLTHDDLPSVVMTTIKILESSDFSLGDLELKLYQLADKLKISPSKYFMFLRLKLTGQTVAPSLFHVINVLGKTEVIARLKS